MHLTIYAQRSKHTAFHLHICQGKNGGFGFQALHATSLAARTFNLPFYVEEQFIYPGRQH